MKILLATLLVFAAADARAAGTPVVLSKIAAKIEDCYDKALAEDFEAVDKDAAAVERQWKAYRPQAKKDGAQEPLLAAEDRAVAAMKTAAAEKASATKVARAANAMSSQMATFYALYRPATPPSLMTLDYLGRELTLDARDGNFGLAGAHLEWLRRTWDGVKTGAASVAAEPVKSYEAAVADARAAQGKKDAAALGKSARSSLEALDKIEAAFNPPEPAEETAAQPAQ